MAVLRLSDGSIWVHSPVSLDDELAAALAELGEVKHIVTPNFEHTKYAQQVGSGPFIPALHAGKVGDAVHQQNNTAIHQHLVHGHAAGAGPSVL